MFVILLPTVYWTSLLLYLMMWVPVGFSGTLKAMSKLPFPSGVELSMVMVVFPNDTSPTPGLVVALAVIVSPTCPEFFWIRIIG